MTYDYSYDYSGDLEELLDNFFYGLEEFFYDFDPALIFGIILIPFLILMVFLLVCYIIRAVAVSGLAKKFGKTNGGLAWIPVCQDIFCTVVLSDLTEKPYFSIHPKIDKLLKLHNRKTAFYAYLGCAVVLPLIVSGFSYVISFIVGLIPVIGIFIAGIIGFILGLIPTVIIAAFKFAYLRDVLDALKRDKDENQRMALIITIVNHFLPLVEPIYLLTLRKYTPLDPQEYCDPYGAPYGNPYGAPYGNPYAAPGYPPYGYPYNNPYNNPYNAPAGDPMSTNSAPVDENITTNPEGTENSDTAQSDTASDRPSETQSTPDNTQSSYYNAQQNNQGHTQWQNPSYPPYGAPYPPYGYPNQPPYGTPGQPPYGTPNQSPFGAPNQPPFGTPGQAPFGASGQPPFGSPPPYGTPGAAPYGAPGNPPYGAPFNNPPSPPDPTAP